MKIHYYIDVLLVISIIASIIILFKLVNKTFSEKKESKKKINENFNDYFDCYLRLTDISPQFVNQYMKFDNQHVSNGRCKDATLHVEVEPCPLDDNGLPLSSCRQNATLTSSKGNPLTFPYDITPSNVSNYFGINTAKMPSSTTTSPSTFTTEPITESITTTTKKI